MDEVLDNLASDPCASKLRGYSQMFEVDVAIELPITEQSNGVLVATPRFHMVVRRTQGIF